MRVRLVLKRELEDGPLLGSSDHLLGLHTVIRVRTCIVNFENEETHIAVFKGLDLECAGKQRREEQEYRREHRVCVVSMDEERQESAEGHDIVSEDAFRTVLERRVVKWCFKHVVCV